MKRELGFYFMKFVILLNDEVIGRCFSYLPYPETLHAVTRSLHPDCELLHWTQAAAIERRQATNSKQYGVRQLRSTL